MKFELTILGCGSATPTMRNWPTSQLLEHDSHLFMIDCGEGAQLQLRRFKIRFQKIRHIFISHNHGDHCLGLPGLISTMHLLGRTEKLSIYAQKGLKEAVEIQLAVSHSRLRFQIDWIELDPGATELIYENKKLSVHSFPLNHRVPCSGFRLSEKAKLRNIRKEVIEEYNLSVPRIRQIKEGKDHKLPDGTVIPNSELTLDPEPPLSYAFCSDTAYSETVVEAVSGVDLLYHESTFLIEDQARARETFHSTTSDAAKVAAKAKVGKLLLGHYSARYKNHESFREEAAAIFPNVEAVEEGMRFSVENVKK